MVVRRRARAISSGKSGTGGNALIPSCPNLLLLHHTLTSSKCYDVGASEEGEDVVVEGADEFVPSLRFQGEV